MRIRDLRQALQEPRKPYDTPYGRWVMRRFSIFITALLIPTPATPTQVTLLSIAAGVWGAVLLFQGKLLSGWLLVNLWYLLDHVDGELARYRKRVSATGLYLDTLANAIVQPLALACFGYWLSITHANLLWLGLGILASYNSLMLMILPFCEATVFFQWMIDKNARYLKPAGSPGSPGANSAAPATFQKKLFGFIHFLTAFPSILPLFTIASFARPFLPQALEAVLLYYAALSSVVWPMILANQIATKKLDQKISLDV